MIRYADASSVGGSDSRQSLDREIHAELSLLRLLDEVAELGQARLGRDQVDDVVGSAQ